MSGREAQWRFGGGGGGMSALACAPATATMSLDWWNCEKPERSSVCVGCVCVVGTATG